jgi:hypothetical protein
MTETIINKKNLGSKNLTGKRMTASSKFSRQTRDCHFNNQRMHAGYPKCRVCMHVGRPTTGHVCLCFSSKSERQEAKLQAGSTGIEHQHPLKVKKKNLL